MHFILRKYGTRSPNLILLTILDRHLPIALRLVVQDFAPFICSLITFLSEATKVVDISVSTGLGSNWPIFEAYRELTCLHPR